MKYLETEWLLWCCYVNVNIQTEDSERSNVQTEVGHAFLSRINIFYDDNYQSWSLLDDQQVWSVHTDKIEDIKHRSNGEIIHEFLIILIWQQGRIKILSQSEI